MKCNSCGNIYDETASNQPQGHSTCPFCLTSNIRPVYNNTLQHEIRDSTEPVMIKIQNPIATGFKFAFGVFLFSLVLTAIAAFIGICATIILAKIGLSGLIK